MRFCLYIFFGLFFLRNDTTAQSYGLAFSSYDAVQEKRTSLDLSPGDSLCFDSNAHMEFDLNFKANQSVYFGYIFRLINGGQNIDLICINNTFKMVVGQQQTGIVFDLDTFSLYNGWNRFSLFLNFSGQQLRLTVNGKLRGEFPVQYSGHCFNALLGANDHGRFNTRDVPPMCIRDIRFLERNQEKYHWSLADTSGEWSRDLIGKRSARINNPTWIKPHHLHWELAAALTVAGNAGVAFDPKNDLLYIAGSDSMWTFRPGMGSNAWQTTGNPYENLLLGNQAIYDTLSRRLYDIFIDQQKVVGYDPFNARWDGAFRDTILTEYWHANKFISPVDSALYVLAGYGQLKYKNLVQRYQFGKKRWEMLPTRGDFFTPRYLAALGTNKTGDTAYIIGGYGSPTGDQTLNPGNYFDMYRFEVRTRSFKRLFSLDSTHGPYVFANSLVLEPDQDTWYGLIFRNGSFDTQLQLIKGSLKNNSFEYVGTPIPYSFYDIQSFADLYYSPRSKKLIAVTLFGSKEEDKIKKTAVKVYTIDFPPEPATALATASGVLPGKGSWWWVLLAAATLVAIGTAGWLFIKKKRPAAHQSDDLQKGQQGPGAWAPAAANIVVANDQDTRPAIHLFGQFLATGKDGNDLTKAFTPLLKELFLLILTYTIRNKKGISSEALDEILWYDKSKQDAKNNRSVNIAKLKIILGRMGAAVIVKEAGFWQFQPSDENIYVDYQEFMSLKFNATAMDKGSMLNLLQLMERGAFLPQTEYNWLDDIKSEVSNKVIDRCLTYIKGANLAEEAEFIIRISNAMFHFDRLDEDALRYKCKCLILLKRHALANDTFVKFTQEYKEIYREEFPQSFNEIIK